MTVLGIDVSNHQQAINFAQVRAAGYSFVVIKVSEGTVFTDPMMVTYRANAHAAGLQVGFYHFAGSSVNKRVYDPAAEATFFAKAVGALSVGEFLVLDFEPFGYTNLGSYDMVQWAKTWLDTATKLLGPRPLIYMSGAHLSAYTWTPIASTYGLWLAQYDRNQSQPTVPYWGVPAMKQFYDKAVVPGVSTSPPCDVDVFYGTAAQLAAYGYQGVAPMSVNGPASWDAADWSAFAAQIGPAVWSYKTSGQGVQAQDRLTGIDNIQLPNIAKALGAIPTAAPQIDVNALAAKIAATATADEAQQVANEVVALLAQHLNTPPA